MESANTIQHKLRPSLLLELQNSYQHVLKLPLNPERNFDRVYFLRAKKILWRYLFKSSYKMTEEKFVQVFRVSNKCLFEVKFPDTICTKIRTHLRTRRDEVSQYSENSHKPPQTGPWVMIHLNLNYLNFVQCRGSIHLFINLCSVLY